MARAVASGRAPAMSFSGPDLSPHVGLQRLLTQLLRALWWPALRPQADGSQPCRSSPVSLDFWREGVPL